MKLFSKLPMTNAISASSVSGAMGIAPYDLNLHRRETPGLRTNKGIHFFFLLFLAAIYFAASSSCDLLKCVSGCLHPLDNLIKCMFSSFRNYVIRYKPLAFHLFQPIIQCNGYVMPPISTLHSHGLSADF